MSHTFTEGNPGAGMWDGTGRSVPRLFKLLCVLTILGNLFLLAANLLKGAMLASGIRSGGVGAEAAPYLTFLLQLVLLTCVGAIVGAALMLRGKLLGYRIYAVSNVLHLALTFGAMLLWAATIYLIFLSFFLFLYALIPVAFLLYFRRNKDCLT